MDAGRLGGLLALLKKASRNPLQLRFLVAGGMLGAWYLAGFAPISDGIATATLQREKAEAHLALAREIESLRAQADAFRDRVPKASDKKEWIEFTLSGIRKFPVKLLKLEPQAPRALGPFELVVLKVELQGSFADLEALLTWLENNPRLTRVDIVGIQKEQGIGGGLLLRLTLLGVVG